MSVIEKERKKKYIYVCGVEGEKSEGFKRDLLLSRIFYICYFFSSSSSTLYTEIKSPVNKRLMSFHSYH